MFLRAAVLAGFAALLMLPGVQMLTGFLREPPQMAEERALYELPPLSAATDPERFWQLTQNWFRDQYGLRTWLIRAKTQWDYSVFGVADKVYVGTDGWLFYKAAVDEGETRNDALTLLQVDAIADNFSRLRDWLAARNIRLIVMTNQLKTRLYPEFFPQRVRGFAERHRRFDYLESKLKSMPGITYFGTTELLLDLKPTMQVFHKTDLHWNDAAAFHAARALVDKIAHLEGHSPAWKYDMKIEHSPYKYPGMESANMPMIWPWAISEDPVLIETHEKSDAIDLDVKPGPPFDSIARAKPNATGLLPGIFVYSDSFVDAMMRAGLQNHFAWMYRTRWRNATLAQSLENIPPGTKYFVFQFIEPHMYDFAEMTLPGEGASESASSDTAR